MDNNKIESILNKLLDLSRLNKINWERNTKSEISFKCILGDNLIYVSGVQDSYLFLIFNSAAEEIGRLEGSKYYFQLKDLFILAKNMAFKVDDTLDKIDSILDSLK